MAILKINKKRVKVYSKWIKKQINYKILAICICTFFVGCTYTECLNKEYDKIDILNEKEVKIEGIIIGDKQEEKYKNTYTFKINKIGKDTSLKGKKTILNIKKQKKENKVLEYGDKISFIGTFYSPEDMRNEGGFSDREYLKSKKLIGRVNTSYTSVNIIQKDTYRGISKISNYISKKIKESINILLPDKTRGLCLAILLGDKSNVDIEIINNFRDSSLAHMLAVSGDHVNYIILGISLFLYKIKFSKKISSIISICILILFMFITSFTTSVVRACIMGIILLGSNLFYRKYDFLSGISISVLILLTYNPFVIKDIGFWLSYGGVIGIVLYYPIIKEFIESRKQNIYDNNKNEVRKKERKSILKRIRDKIIENIKNITFISISANIVLIPIIMANFNTVSFTFVISNILASFIMGTIVILGFSFCIIGMFKNLYINFILGHILNFFLEILIQITNFCSNIPLSKIYIIPPNKYLIGIYYIFIFMLWYYLKIKNKEYKRYIHNFIIYKFKIKRQQIIKYIKENTKYFVAVLILIFIFMYIIKIIPKDIIIHMVDVGQGDCVLIKTRMGKTILIDGGGSDDINFDVGEKTLLPYLLNKGINKIDYIIISHFDSDHCKGVMYVMKEIKVNNVIIGSQFEESDNYKQFINIIKKKNIKTFVVEKGQSINIEKDLYLDILWPDSGNIIKENVLNNNSLVCKLKYKNFSMLFTGDIEEKAEKIILDKYDYNLKILKSTILKVAHHRF